MMIGKSGRDDNEEEEDGEEGPMDEPAEGDWEAWAQYTGGMACMNAFIKFMQHNKVLVHEELYFAKSTMEELSAPWFVMAENLSKKIGDEVEKDLTVSCRPWYIMHFFKFHLY